MKTNVVTQSIEMGVIKNESQLIYILQTVERLARLGISETKSLIEAIQPQSCQSYVSRSFLLT